MVETIRPLLFLFALAFVIAFLHALGHAYGLYFTISWYDTPLHLMGGAWLASASLVSAGRLPFLRRFLSRPVFVLLLMLGTALVVGGLWELYEYGLDAWYGKPGFVRGDDPLRNTGTDLMNDGIGALIVYAWYYIADLRKQRMDR